MGGSAAIGPSANNASAKDPATSQKLGTPVRQWLRPEEKGAVHAVKLAAKTLTVRLHYLSHDAQVIALSHLCEQLNAAKAVFPGTNLRIVYEQLGSE